MISFNLHTYLAMVCPESEVSVLPQERTAVAKSGASAAPRTFLESPTEIFKI
jgi:hypothetical protein